FKFNLSQIDDLYEEILYEIANNIGCESSEVGRASLIEFAQDAFKISNERHEDILKMAEQKEPPNIRLNVEIIKAENLMPKDSNGFSDPFVTLYLESNGSHRYNSSVKTETLNPIWEEHFSLPIVDNPRKEVLILEVWDFDAAETVKEKVNKLLDVKGVKGLRKLMKEIAMTASTGKHDNELIGRTAITLKSIPVSGCTIWYNLEKGTKTKSRGSILINLALSAEKNKQVAVQEHRHLLKLLLMHELESSKVANYWWNGKFSANAETIRSQHAVQSGLSSFDCALSQWSVYATIHEEHPLSFSLFNSILDVVIPVLKCHLNESEDMKTFWDGAKRILPSCFSVLRKLRAKNVSDKQIVKTLCDVLDIFAKINTLPPSENIDLFPPNIYGWINRTEDSEYSIDKGIEDAIHTGTKEWLEHIIEGNRQSNNEQSDDENLQYLIKLIQMIRSDLQRAMEYFDKHFYHKMRLNFSAILLTYYDKKMVEIVKSIVSEVCSNIKRLHIPDELNETLPDLSDINMGTTLFELYLVLKRFLTLAFIKELGTDDVIKRLGEFRSNLEAERCEITIRNVIENALDTERNQIMELLEIVARKMAPPIRRFLAEGAEVLHEDSNSMERLMMYLESSLGTLYNTLNEVNFARILDAIWAELSIIMYDLIQSNLDKRRPPAFFQNLRQTLHVMISCFKTGNFATSDVEVLTEIERILDLHAFETADLIHQYYLERLGHQKEINKSEYGQLTIRANFTEAELKLDIMNARNLVPMDSNGSCDSFVKGHFMPSNRFLGDICRCCVYYAQKMSRRVEDLTKDEGELFHVSTEWCLAINNIDYIRQSLPAFIK
uniref:C2 domain-containing protein n=1 Tax=Glossina brevipalpis TaxID=37001 RepID=A0A1A9WYQ6_9MUSC